MKVLALLLVLYFISIVHYLFAGRGRGNSSSLHASAADQEDEVQQESEEKFLARERAFDRIDD